MCQILLDLLEETIIRLHFNSFISMQESQINFNLSFLHSHVFSIFYDKYAFIL